MGEREWRPIEEAPKDGSRQWVKRVHDGHLIREGFAVWGVNCADAPMRRELDGGLGGPIPPDHDYADTPRWLTEDRMYSFPTPTHWRPA